MRAKTSGSWLAIQRSFAVTSCWLMPLPASLRKAASSVSARRASTSRPQRPSDCWMEGRSTTPSASSSTTAGSMPVTPTPAIASAAMPASPSSSGTISHTFDHQSCGSSSAQP